MPHQHAMKSRPFLASVSFKVTFLILSSLLTLSSAPLSAGVQTLPSDPAVEYANEMRQDNIAYSEDYFQWNGMRLHYVEAGEGDLIIFYHGFPSFWYSFIDQMEALKSQYRVVAIDGLGSGLSDKPRSLEYYTVENLAAQLDEFAKHLVGEEKFYLVGHDWGAALAWSYAEAYPERLRGVVGMSAPSYNVFLTLIRSSELQRQTSNYMRVIAETPYTSVVENPPGERLWSIGYSKLIESNEIAAEEGELFRQALAPSEASNGAYNWYRANVPLFDQVSNENYWPNPQADITVPALLIWGDQDKTFVKEFIQLMHDRSTQLEVQVMPDVGHWTSIEQAGLSITLIQDFLASTRDSQSK